MIDSVSTAILIDSESISKVLMIQGGLHLVEGVTLGEEELVRADAILAQLLRDVLYQVPPQLPEVDVLLPEVLEDQEG